MIHVGLGQDRKAGVVHHRQQVHRWAGVVAAAAQGLDVDRDRRPRRPGWRWRPGGRYRWLLVGQPPAERGIQGVDTGQHPTHGGLAGWPPDAVDGSRRTPQRGQDMARCVGDPFADGCQGPRPGQHRAHRDAEHADQRMLWAAPLPGSGTPAR